MPPPPASWPELTSGIIALRAPLAAEALPACGRCTTQCRLPLDNRGTLAILDAPPPESYQEALDHFAPDSSDISLWRSVASNWKTIDGLTERVRHEGFLLDSFRFIAPGSRGVVTLFEVEDSRRYVVYAYAVDGNVARVIGVSGLSRERFAHVLGGLRVEPGATQRPSRCVAGVAAPPPAVSAPASLPSRADGSGARD